MSLRGFARVFLRTDPGGRADGDRLDGPGGDAHALIRAVLTQLAVFHAPDDLLVAVCAGPERRARWDWTKWLPHSQPHSL